MSKEGRIGNKSSVQELLDNIAFASARVGYIQTNADGTHAKECCCRWCVSRRWNETHVRQK
jgi:hypothetical protein